MQKLKIMKTILKLLVLAVMFTGVNSYAMEDDGSFRLHVIKNDGKTISFAINKLKQAKITIYENDGTVIFSEKTKGNENGILKTYDLEALPAGNYILEVENDTKKVAHKITITNGSSTLSADTASVDYKNSYKGNNSTVATATIHA